MKKQTGSKLVSGLINTKKTGKETATKNKSAKNVDLEKILKQISLKTAELVDGYYGLPKYMIVINAFKAFIDLETAMNNYYNALKLGLSTDTPYFYPESLQQAQVELALQSIRLALNPANLISEDTTKLLENMQDYMAIRYYGTKLGQD